MATDTLWERIKSGIRGGATTAAERAEYFGRIGRARLDIAGARHAIQEAFAELGGTVYNILQAPAQADISADQTVQDVVGKIRDLEMLLQEREANLEVLRSGGEETKGPDSPAG